MTRFKKELVGAYTNESKAQREVANEQLSLFEDIKKEPPTYLSEKAQKLFIDTIEANKKGSLKQIDQALLAIWSQTYANVIDSTEHIKIEGLVVDGKTNPYTRIFNQQSIQLKQLSVELGITPNSRAKIEINQSKNHEDERTDPFKEVVNSNG